MTMKKLCFLLSLLLMVPMLSGCSGTNGNAGKGAATTDSVPVILNQAEYLLYQNIFYNDYGPQYEGQDVTKHGVFAKVRDAFNSRDRYYVWGYMDNTKCCDWQWEFVPKDEKNLPAPGSQVTVKGVFRANDDALDGYWITDAAVETEAAYTGVQDDLNMVAMSCTLERVQILNIQYRPEDFEGRSFSAYGRIAGVDNTLENPYYNGSWQMPFTSGDASPSIGTLVVLRGTVKNAALADCSLSVMQ